MPVEKNQKLTLIDFPEKGVNTNLDPNVNISAETQLTVVCESPTCDVKISWIMEQSGSDAEGVPDDAFRILILEEFGGTKHVFCSWDCLRRSMKSYTPPLSPREKAEIETHNASLTPTVVSIPVPNIPGIDTSRYVEAIKEQSAALSQPDGFAEENTSE